MNREIWWIRHAETTWNSEGRWQGHTDVPLSDLGQQQAQALGRRLEGQAFDGVFSSDLERTIQTSRLALPDRAPVQDARLREINFGHFEGVTRAELSPEKVTEWDAWWKDPFNLRVTGGESMTDLGDRVQAWMDELPPEGRFAAFTHGGVIRCMFWKITGAPPEGRWSVQLDNTSLTKVRLRENRTIILCLNDCSHLS